jgi:hypothetical protein
MSLAGAFLLPALAAGRPFGAGQFCPRNASAGLTPTFDGEWEFVMVGGGTAVFDCSGDGLPDVFVPGGSYQRFRAIPERQRSAARWPFRKRRQPRGLRLDDGDSGAYPLDIDSDGVMDLVVLRVGENAADAGLGDCKFKDATRIGGFRRRCLVHRLCRDLGTWADWPTLAFGNYIDRTQEEAFPWGSCTDNCCIAARRPFDAPAADPVVLRLVDAVHRLEPLGARPACGCRTTANTTRAGRNRCGTWSRASRPGFTPRRRLETAAHLGDGHRQPRCDAGRLSRLLPDLDGRQQAAGAEGPGPASRDYADKPSSAA